MAKKTEIAEESAKITVVPAPGAALENENETAMDMAKRLTQEVEDYKKLVDTKMTQEELDEMEKEIITIIETNDEHLKCVMYDLPASVDFEGTSYTRSAVATKIIYFISKIEQSWQFVKGLYDLCGMWKQSTFDKISYGALDSTLRLLDQGKFKGMQEWRDILIINEYMKPLHEAYAKETTYQIANGQKHSAIIARRDMIDPVKAAAGASDDRESQVPELDA